MNISRENLVKIKELLSLQKQGKYDLNLIPEIIEFFNKNTIFDLSIAYKKVFSNCSAYVSDEVIYYSDNLINIIREYIDKYKFFPNYDEDMAYNYMLLEIIFHELTHINQVNMALTRSSKYSVINDLYYMIYFVGNKNYNHYINNKTDYSQEYNANLESLKILQQIFNDNEFLNELNMYQFKNNIKYYYMNQKFISERTFDAEKISDKSIIRVNDISTDISIINGLPVEKEILLDINNVSLEKTRKKYNL